MRRPAGDDGTVLVLLLGLFAILLVMVAGVTNVSSVVLAKRGVASAADGAAIAAAQALDLDALYDRGLAGGRVPLSQDGAQERVAAYAAQARAEQPGLQMAVEVREGTAVVLAFRDVTMPFGGVFGLEPVRVRAEARARAPVVAP